MKVNVEGKREDESAVRLSRVDAPFRRWRAQSEPKVLQISLNEAENRAYGQSLRSMSERTMSALQLASLRHLLPFLRSWPLNCARLIGREDFSRSPRFTTHEFDKTHLGRKPR